MDGPRGVKPTMGEVPRNSAAFRASRVSQVTAPRGRGAAYPAAEAGFGASSGAGGFRICSTMRVSYFPAAKPGC